ncbi:MAG: DNA polymerase III subunit delta [Chloroflexi bacterium]|nr:DNA polymerase III subunit delta [Chloroflexota bacterium]
MIYVLHGADDYSLHNRLEELKGEGDGESLSLNTTSFDGQQLTLSDLITACDALPFLGRSRLVIVEGLLSRFEPKEGGRQPDLGEWQALGGHASRMPPTTTLVLVDGKIGKNNPLLKRLKPVSEVEEFPAVRGAKLHQWIQSRVASSGGRISPQAVKLLSDLAGDSLWALANEIEKLCLYSRGRRIEEGDVRQVTTYAREATIFNLIDAIVEKRIKAALQLLHQSLAEGMAPPYLLAMLTRQLRLMIQARELGTQRLSMAQKQEQLGLAPNYPVEKLLSQSARYPMPRLIQIHRKLLEADIAIKTGRLGDRLALDLLVAEVCS